MGLISNGTTIFDAGALDSGIATGAMTHIKTLTASSSGTLSFVHGASSVVLDGTYKEYIFFFNNIHPASNDIFFTFQGSIDSGSNYNISMTTTYFDVYNAENDSGRDLRYLTGLDQANATSFQPIAAACTNGNDESSSGTLHLFEPSSTTFVKHYISRIEVTESAYSKDNYSSGYFNTTSAINAVQFKFASGNIDSGTISLYGIN